MSSHKLYAMKTINKEICGKDSESLRVNLNSFLLEKEIGLLGKECRFITKLITTFQNEVFKL